MGTLGGAAPAPGGTGDATVSASGLVIYNPCDQTSGSTLTDNSGSNLNATLVTGTGGTAGYSFGPGTVSESTLRLLEKRCGCRQARSRSGQCGAVGAGSALGGHRYRMRQQAGETNRKSEPTPRAAAAATRGRRHSAFSHPVACWFLVKFLGPFSCSTHHGQVRDHRYDLLRLWWDQGDTSVVW